MRLKAACQLQGEALADSPRPIHSLYCLLYQRLCCSCWGASACTDLQSPTTCGEIGARVQPWGVMDLHGQRLRRPNREQSCWWTLGFELRGEGTARRDALEGTLR